MNKITSVDDYISRQEKWKNELIKLRKILLSTKLVEDVKWGIPCYTFNGKNVVGIAGFKSYFGLWFYQGALLKDSEQVLINAQEGKTKALRQWRMTTASDIKISIIKSFVKEAIEHIKIGKEIPTKSRKPLTVPTELASALKNNKQTAERFKALPPGLRREYAEYISDAKRNDTKLRRIEKISPMINKGIGLNDKYR